MKILSEYSLGDMSVRYVLAEDGQVGMELYPASMKPFIKRAGAIRLIRWCSGRKRETPFPMALPTV